MAPLHIGNIKPTSPCHSYLNGPIIIPCKDHSKNNFF